MRAGILSTGFNTFNVVRFVDLFAIFFQLSFTKTRYTSPEERKKGRLTILLVNTRYLAFFALYASPADLLFASTRYITLLFTANTICVNSP